MDEIYRNYQLAGKRAKQSPQGQFSPLNAGLLHLPTY
jgi:hypothetical protein